MADKFRVMLFGMLTSKKALATAAGLIVASLGRYGLGIPEDTVIQILGILASFVVGQGIADIGKVAVPATFVEALKAMVVTLCTDKKSLAALVAILVTTAGRYGLGIPEDMVLKLISSLSVYMVGQGVAEVGQKADPVSGGVSSGAVVVNVRGR